MTPTTEVLPERKTENSAVALIREAMSSGASPEYLRELLAVKKDWDAAEATKSFNIAVADFQRRCPIIPKDDKAYKQMYARIDRIWREIRPLLGELGLAVTWQICEMRDGLCHVEGQLGHREGHSQRLVYDCPLPAIIKSDMGKDVQNAAQQMGSASTYAKRYAMCAALGIVTGDDAANDDDGNKAGTRFVTFDQAQELGEMVDACRGVAGFHEAKFWEWVGGTVAAEIPAAMYDRAKAALKKRLTGGAT